MMRRGGGGGMPINEPGGYLFNEKVKKNIQLNGQYGLEEAILSEQQLVGWLFWVSKK
jgi:hypothetical protein